MCMECGIHPCHPACPNADEPPVVFKCTSCGDNILRGERYVGTLGDDHYCMDCAWEMEAAEDDLDDESDDAYEVYRNLMMEEEAV